MTGTLLEQEIHQQPSTLTRLITSENDSVARIASAIRERAPRFALIAARGSSDNAAIYGKYVLGAFAGLPVALAAPSITTYYGRLPDVHDALVIGISQSGQGEDVVEVVRQARAGGAVTLGVTNFLDSPLAQAAEHVVALHAGQERSLAATKTFTAQLAVMALLAAYLADDPARHDDLAQLPDWVAHALALSAGVPARAERYRYMALCVTVGRGFNYATAFELALKLKELTYIGATPYSSADFRHGPIAQVEAGFPVLAVAPQGVVSDDMLDLLRDLQERRAELIVISNDERALDLARTPLVIPAVPEWLSPIVGIVPGQLLAFGLSQAKGYDVDRPRTLHKVTSTR
ncbi:MAG: SIS domain-containing protein [Anaerolineae bacterium]|nr:SIS domain-containing protein [Anaerolineae bacterium]